ncbi:MAG: hypothetical protein ACK53A_00915 [Gemmatimonadota bacterium]|nr:hypothetical protein [Gemmatimonadota bacterium]
MTLLLEVRRAHGPARRGALLMALFAACGRPDAPAVAVIPAGMNASPMTDDRDAARLCGYLATRPETPMRFPWPSGADSTVTPYLLAYVDGPQVRGVRVVVPGTPARYVFRGVTRDGRQRLSFERPVPGLDTPAAMAAAEGRPPAALLTLDSVAATAGVPVDSSRAPLGAAWPDSASEPDRAVPDLHRLPESRVTLDVACPVATIGTQALPRVDRIFRVEVPAGRTLSVRARGSVHDLLVTLDAPATPDSARTRLRRVALDSLRVGEARTVTVRVRTVPRARDQEASSFVVVTLRLT